MQIQGELSLVSEEALRSAGIPNAVSYKVIKNVAVTLNGSFSKLNKNSSTQGNVYHIGF